MSNIVIVLREVEAITVPYGKITTLMPGQEVTITQEMGDNFTLNSDGRLVYLSGCDADAIGKKSSKLPSDNIPKNNDYTVINNSLLWSQLKTIYDPEIPVNIVDLGLVYDLSYIKVKQEKNMTFYNIRVSMTLTSPGCGIGPVLMREVENKLRLIPNISDVDVILVFDPPWTSDMMTDCAKLELGFL